MRGSKTPEGQCASNQQFRMCPPWPFLTKPFLTFEQRNDSQSLVQSLQVFIFLCCTVASCVISLHESCRLKLQKKKSRQKRFRTQSCVAIHYSTWPYFVDRCCCMFDGKMGNMVNQLVCCLGRTKTRGQGKVSLGIGRHGSRAWRGVGQCWAQHTSIECEAFRSIRTLKMKLYYVIFFVLLLNTNYSVIFGMFS